MEHKKEQGYHNSKKWSYVVYLDHSMPDGKKMQYAGPYSSMQADKIMIEFLAEGYCAWIERKPIKKTFRRDDKDQSW